MMTSILLQAALRSVRPDPAFDTRDEMFGQIVVARRHDRLLSLRSYHSWQSLPTNLFVRWAEQSSRPLSAALLSAGRLDKAVSRFEQSLAVESDWANHGLNAYALALAHHRLGNLAPARRWLDIAER
jgi:hypothetical protein